MIVPITQDRWTSARKALDETGDRFAELLERAARTTSNATRDWSVADTAAHVATLARIYASIVDANGRPYPFPGAENLVNETVVDTVDDFNEELLGEFTERDPEKIGRVLRADLDTILQVTEGADPAAAIPWLGGSEVPLAGVLAHLVNEFQIHGRDVALAAGSPWVVPPEEAGLFFDLFLLGVTHYGYGRLLDGHGPAPKGRVAVEFSSKFTSTRVMALTDGFVTVEEPGGGPVDVRLSFNPVTLNLMLFGRISKARAAFTGGVVLRGGRRPWTLPSFLRIVRLPS
ncbi:maleylpyruvate isomerase N-terminal domain-containing protein [Actinomadura sp. 1N219]|uniref:maleylpyruvate isomerase N-terminal domain-containing protein n=1 Tax=Actinomadura sp. 1N219 TaxID=3375152 RepID=UPI00378E558E